MTGLPRLQTCEASGQDFGDFRQLIESLLGHVGDQTCESGPGVQGNGGIAETNEPRRSVSKRIVTACCAQQLQSPLFDGTLGGKCSLIRYRRLLSVMATGTQKFGGWPIGEAIRRCSDPDLLGQWFANHRAWVAAGRRGRFMFLSELVDGQDAIRHNYRERLAKALRHQNLNSYAQLLNSLKVLLRKEKLLAWGRRESPMASRAPIPASAWSHLSITSVGKSIVAEKTDAKTKIFDIRIFPIAEAPDAVDRLDGKTFVEAFQTCVVDDPQVAVLNKLVISARGEPVRFGNEWETHRAVWSADHGNGPGSGGALGFLRKIEEPIKFNREVAAGAAISRRFAKLMEFLSTGQLVAEGVSAASGTILAIPRSIWRRSQTYIDLVNGDILEHKAHAEDHTTALTGPTFTGLMLLKAGPGPESSAIDVASERQVVPIRKSIQRVLTRANAETACSRWLMDLMRSSPKEKPQAKVEYWKQAQNRWPETLGKRGFDRAWGAAAKKTKGCTWSASGRLKSSQ